MGPPPQAIQEQDEVQQHPPSHVEQEIQQEESSNSTTTPVTTVTMAISTLMSKVLQITESRESSRAEAKPAGVVVAQPTQAAAERKVSAIINLSFIL